MKKYGLIGYPLTHSFSQKYFTEKFDAEGITDSVYQLYPLESIDKLPGLLQSEPYLLGLNVTIPYKEAVLPYLHELESTAAAIGAVNCIKVEQDKLIGYNTDVYGFHASLQSLLKHKPDVAFVLGTGGAAKAVWYVLQALHIPFLKVSASSAEHSISYTDIAGHLQNSNLVVNTTPLGMYPNVTQAPLVPFSLFSANDYFIDLVYNPAHTMFMQLGRAQGSTVMNGQLMLERQAERSWHIWSA